MGWYQNQKARNEAKKAGLPRPETGGVGGKISAGLNRMAEFDQERHLGVKIADGRVVAVHSGESVALAGATAMVDTAGDIERRITATRLVLAGPLALAMRKKKDHRELFLTVEGSDGAFVVEVPPKFQLEARQLAARITTEGKAA